jgi:hypothetical protein
MTQERGRPVDSYRFSTAPTNWVTAASASLSASDLETQCVEISSSVALERVSEEIEGHSRVGMWWFILGIARKLEAVQRLPRNWEVCWSS